MYNINLLWLQSRIPLSNFRIVSEQGRTKDLTTQNWQLYKSPERASAVSTNIWGDQPSRRSGLGFIVFGSEAWVPVTSLCVWKSISCLLSLIPKICLSFSCSSSVQHWESLGLFGLIVHSTAHLPIYTGHAVYHCYRMGMSRSMPLALDGLVGILLCNKIKHELSPSCLFSSVQKTGAQQGAFSFFLTWKCTLHMLHLV